MPLRLGHDDLVLSHFSLPRDTPFVDRVAAAAEAGFAGIGWYVGDYVRHRDEGWSDRDVQRVLDEHRVVLHEVDALPLDRLGFLDDAVHLATSFGAHHLQVQGDRPGTVEDAAAAIAVIADRVASAGVRVAIEFVGNKNIRTAADALELTELSGRENVGVQVDIWHHVRGASDWSMLESLPPARIVSVQFDDGPLLPVYPGYTEDTVRSRTVPGEGEMDVARFLRTVHPPTCRLPLSLEVISDELLALPVREAARRIAEATRAVQARPHER
jgi:sugar phosphate isomerase/epimerase